MNIAVACSNCALYNTAKVLGLESLDCSQLDQVVVRNHPVKKGQHLYQAADPFQHLYLIHSGSCVSTGKLASGHEQILGYYLPGEIAGFESIGQTHHDHTTVALESGSVCQLDFTGLRNAVTDRELISIQDYLLRAAAAHAAQLQWERSVTGLQSAEHRVGAFLLNISSRYRTHGMPHEVFRLSMSRDSIAQYLGLATETVIRTLRKLQSLGFLEVKAKQIRLLNSHALSRFIKGASD